MTILFDATKAVKTARTFGKGLLSTGPVYRDPVSRSDREWAAANLNQGCADYDTPSDAEYEQAAGEALAMSRAESGVFGAY